MPGERCFYVGALDRALPVQRSPMQPNVAVCVAVLLPEKPKITPAAKNIDKDIRIMVREPPIAIPRNAL